MSEQVISDLSRPNLDSSHPPNNRFPFPAPSLDIQLSPEDLMKPFFIDSSSITFRADPHYSESEKLDSRSTDYSQVSYDGSRFCAFSGESQNSFYFGPRIYDELDKLPTIATISEMQKKIAEIYYQYNNPSAIEVFGTFGVVFNTPDKKTAGLFANCGGLAYLYRSNQNEIDFSANHLGQVSHDKHSIHRLTDTKLHGSIGGENNNPNYLSVTTVMLQPGDVVLITPNQIGHRTDHELFVNLSKTGSKSSSDIAKSNAEIIRKGSIENTNKTKDATTLVVSALTSSNYIDDREVKSDYVTTMLKQFENAKSLDDIVNFIEVMGGIRGLNKLFSPKEITDLIYDGKLKNIPRAGGLRETVERLTSKTSSTSNQLSEQQSFIVPNEII